jgi:predicted DNA binding CopG/RHH family protein
LRALASTRAKAISLSKPLITLAGAKRVASKRNLPYQRLIIQAVEKFIDEAEKSDPVKKKRA